MMKEIPQVGFGLWKIAQNDCADVVYQAIKIGYRHLDSASDYGNEKAVGVGIKRALDDGLCQRSDLWVTSKLWNTYHAKAHVSLALERTLSDLQLEYLDLYLIHFPISLQFVPFDTRYPPEWVFEPEAESPMMKTSKVPLNETWGAMEEMRSQGLTKQIGVCNYTSGLLHDLMSYAKHKPDVLQIESHPYLTQERLIRLAKNYGLAVTAFSPLGASSYFELDMAREGESVLETSVVKEIADRLGKTSAQVVLRWGVQRGTSIVPKSTRVERMKENLNIFDFELSTEDMLSISALNQNRRFNDPGHFCEDAFNTFYPIYD
jgi:D-xylose reductase